MDVEEMRKRIRGETPAQQMLQILAGPAAGELARVSINGQHWVRHGADSPEGHLASARDKIAELTEKLDIQTNAIVQAYLTALQLIGPFERAIVLHKLLNILFNATTDGTVRDELRKQRRAKTSAVLDREGD